VAKTPAVKAPAKAPAVKAPAKAPAKASPRRLAVRADESPWTARELAEVRAQLDEEAGRLRAEIAAAEVGIADLLRDSGDGAGDDQADAGTKTFEREHEMSLANNSRGMLLQAERALARIDDGTYGICEACGQPIGKARLQAFPRATLCVSCKQKEERR
jgi:DnaK suppressor protein